MFIHCISLSLSYSYLSIRFLKKALNAVADDLSESVLINPFEGKEFLITKLDHSLKKNIQCTVLGHNIFRNSWLV